MNRFLMVAAAVIIGVVVSQVFFNKSSDNTATRNVEQPASSQSTSPAPATQTAAPEISSELISSAPTNARVFITEPADGATVSSPLIVRFGIENMSIAKAGDNVENSGHHHLLINLQELPDLKLPLPATDQLIHFGGGQTETSIELAKGQHTLQLLLGNYLHIPHDKPVISEKITITVE